MDLQLEEDDDGDARHADFKDWILGPLDHGRAEVSKTKAGKTEPS